MRVKATLLVSLLSFVAASCGQTKKNDLSDELFFGLLLLSQKNIVFRIVESTNSQSSVKNIRAGGSNSLPVRFLNDGKLNHSVGCKKARLNIYSIFVWEKGTVTPGKERITNASAVVYDGEWIDNQNGGRMKVSYPLDSGKSFYGISGSGNVNPFAWKDKKYDRIGLKIGAIKCELDEAKLANLHNKYISYAMWYESETGKADSQHGRRSVLNAYPFDNSIEKVNSINYFISATTGYLSLKDNATYFPRIHRNAGTEAAELADPINNPFWGLLTAPFTDRLDFEYLDDEYTMDRYSEDGLIVLDLPDGNRETLILDMYATNNFVYQTEPGLTSAKFSPIDFIKFDHKENEFQNYYLNADFITTNGKYLDSWTLPTPGPNQPNPAAGRHIGYFLPKFGISKE
ncbi:putative lipoprotein [Leptospira wolbachii serovar Codice str. CDC]|uniref:Lipoprotein n=1 Tax=Leptospira wolbachii serovar Codice str. CDC TaxID=1218599 RepID=R9A919_9LEPT|nr:hypothetical protein [Leptospira wolbachii]EOQ98549.1 putative lipoprotein [Leptospira wolbachii serovar Codice str. CDC]